MADDEAEAGPKYVYTGARAPGQTVDVSAGEGPKLLTKSETLLGERDGQGAASFPNGDAYFGEYIEGKRSGKGTYTYAAPAPAEEGEEPKPPIATFDGTWKNGSKSGVGIMTYADGAKYHGSFKGGQRSGEGTFYYASGDIYTGGWVAGRKSGDGTYIFKATSARVKGMWKENKLEDGTFTDKYGNTYTGKFLGAASNAVAYDPAGSFSLCSGATGAVRMPRRLVLYASNTPDKAEFVAMMAPGVAGLEYDFETAGVPEMVALITEAASAGSFDSIALANHGGGSAKGFSWPISKKVVVKNAGGIDKDPLEVLTALGNAVIDNGRVDLLACSLLETPKGRDAFEAIQKATMTHFAASDDVTGSVKSGGDWVMESDGVNVKSLYFGDTSRFTGTFEYDPGTYRQRYDPVTKSVTNLNEVTGKPKYREPVPMMSEDLVENISEEEYIMVGKVPCVVDRVFPKWSATEVMFKCHSLFNEKDLMELKVANNTMVEQPIVNKIWWQVERVERDTITPDLPDKHDTIHLKNETQKPPTLALHTHNRQNETMYIDMITNGLEQGKVEVQVLSACGQTQLVMKRALRDVRLSSSKA